MKHVIKLMMGTALTLTSLPARAALEMGTASDWHPRSLPQAVLFSLVFGALGIAMVVAGFKLFDLVITRIDLEKEIQGGNVAAGILAGAVIVGISLIVAAAIQ